MKIFRGDFGISVCMNDTFGKRPGLYVESRTCALKVGNFASEEKARIFADYLKFLCNLGGVTEDDLWKEYSDDTNGTSADVHAETR